MLHLELLPGAANEGAAIDSKFLHQQCADIGVAKGVAGIVFAARAGLANAACVGLGNGGAFIGGKA